MKILKLQAKKPRSADQLIQKDQLDWSVEVS
jgi:hypothetical protein